MDMSSCLQPPLEIGIRRNHVRGKRFRGSKTRGKLCLLGTNLSSASLGKCTWSRNHSRRIQRRVCTVPSRNRQIRCYCFLNAGPSLDPASVKNATSTLARTFNHLLGSPRLIKLASAAGVVVFAIWGLGPLVRRCRNIFLRKSDSNWKKSSIYHVLASYILPLLLWTGTLFICRQLDPVVLPLEAGQIVKLRVINFVRSLSTVLAFGQCLSSVIQQMQKFFMETNDQTDTRNMGFQFASRALYTAVWVAAVSLFMELLGFSTQKWMTAGGLGTVLLTLAGREILTNFLSSVMIHATRPFVLNEWIQTNIEGYEVSGTVEHVGWWSPTIIRGDDREAIHIPNHKFTVNIVRNLSQKTHWRIKTHLAISHLDVGKVNNIVADMRKVLAKNPQVEQQKLHRRVFLDDINPENQALMILVSCFVKTSHFEEYLCVKEAIILDLIRVITHHRARLATPIRTVQKISTDADLDPFSDSVYAHRAASNHPFLLIEPSYKINGDDRTKTQVHSVHLYGDEDSKATLRSTQSTPDDADDAKVGEELGEKVETKDTKSLSDLKLGNSTTISKTDNSTARQSEAQGGIASTSNLKQDLKPPVAQPPVTKPSLEENIVLGVALDGSKRTLPIDEEDMVLVPPPNSEDMRELAALHGSNGTLVEDKSDSKWTNSPGFVGGDQLDQQA